MSDRERVWERMRERERGKERKKEIVHNADQW